MYDLVKDIISHTWDTNVYGSEQQYIYYICGAMILLLSVIFIDFIYRLIFSFFKKGD